MRPAESGDTPLVAAARQEIARHDRIVHDMVESRPSERLERRPPSGRWSVSEHLAHMALVNGPYLRAMKEAVREGHEQGLTGPGKKKDPLFGRLFVWMLEPPPRPRVRTLRAMEPAPDGLTLDTALRDFDRAQDGFRALLDDVGDLDPYRVRFASPFAEVLRFTLDQGIRVLLAHNRRHLWLCDEALRGLEGAEAS